MELEVVYSIENLEELQELYQTYPWWEDREIENLKQAVEQTDIIIGLRDLQDDSLVASARVLTDYVYYGKVFDVIVDESLRGEGVGQKAMNAITEHPDLQEIEVLTLNCREGLVPFYGRCGFNVKDMTVELPDGTEEDYHVMVRS